MQANSLSLLTAILARESSSLLSYLHGAWPWTSSRERDCARQLQALVEQELEGQRSLAALIRKRRAIPPSARFPMNFTTLHFLAVDHLLPKVVAEQRALLALLEQDAAHLDEATRVEVEPFLAMKRQHVEQLASLAEAHSGSRSLSTLK